MTRRLFILLTIASALVAPAGASAADKTLLSGYGGPGSGEQSLLGGTLLPAPRGDGSLRRAAAPPGGSASATPAPAAGTPAPTGGGSAAGGSGGGERASDRPAPASKTGTGTQKRKAGGRSRDDGAGGGTAETTREGPAAAGQVTSERTAAYPAANDAGSFPVSTSDVLLVLLGLIVLVAVGAVTRGLARTQPLHVDSSLR